MKTLLNHIALWALFSIFISCNGNTSYLSEEGMVWNTIYHISYQSETDLNDSIQAIFQDIDSSVSAFNDSSIVSKINRNEKIAVNHYFKNIYLKSKEINSQSKGMFDPTVAPLIRAWGFGQGHTVSKDTLRIDSLLSLVGIQKTELKGDTLYKENPQIEFNFSGIAKGYGVDCIAEMFLRNGVSNFLIEIGGEIRVEGVNPKGNKWNIGIDKPSKDNNGKINELITDVALTNAGVATSGNYRNYHQAGSGQTFGHTISPLSGRPVQTDLASVTIIAPSCMEADALATACMALGMEESRKLCDSLKISALFITTDLKIVTNRYFDALTNCDRN